MIYTLGMHNKAIKKQSMPIKRFWMKYISILFICLFELSTLIQAQDFPKLLSPPSLVNDFTQTLTEAQQIALEQKLRRFQKSTSTQIAVVLIPSLQGYDISDYAFKMAEQWGIGDKKNNNGVLFLTAINDQKVFIATGYGLEGVLPDAYVKRITENLVVPRYKQKDYFGGINAGTNALIKLSAGEYQADSSIQKGIGKKSILLIFLLVLIVFVFLTKSSNFEHITADGKGGAAGKGMLFLLLLNALGNRGGGGHWNNFNSGSGGFGGSGGGFGGFGGFGGGSFGGGGAGSSW